MEEIKTLDVTIKKLQDERQALLKCVEEESKVEAARALITEFVDEVRATADSPYGLDLTDKETADLKQLFHEHLAEMFVRQYWNCGVADFCIHLRFLCYEWDDRTIEYVVQSNNLKESVYETINLPVVVPLGLIDHCQKLAIAVCAHHSRPEENAAPAHGLDEYDPHWWPAILARAALCQYDPFRWVRMRSYSADQQK